MIKLKEIKPGNLICWTFGLNKPVLLEFVLSVQFTDVEITYSYFIINQGIRKYGTTTIEMSQASNSQFVIL